MYKKGFTLIELIVAITIIGVMLSTAVVAYNELTISSRDARRRTDLELIRGALEQYRSRYGRYPIGWTTTDRARCRNTSTNPADYDITTTTPHQAIGAGSNCILGALVVEGFMSRVPQDPINTYLPPHTWPCTVCGCAQMYTYDSNGDTYSLSAIQESQGNACRAQCTWQSTLPYHYCVGPLGER